MLLICNFCSWCALAQEIVRVQWSAIAIPPQAPGVQYTVNWQKESATQSTSAVPFAFVFPGCQRKVVHSLLMIEGVMQWVGFDKL